MSYVKGQAGKKNTPKRSAGPSEGRHDATFNRGDAGKKRKPPTKPSGEVKNTGSEYSEFADTGF